MRYALDALRRRPGRTALSALGIGLSTGLVVALLAVSAGIDGSAEQLAFASGVDLLITSANTSIVGNVFPPVGGAHRLADVLPAADPNVASASPWLVDDLTFANASLYEALNRSPAGAGLPSAWAPAGASAIGWIPSANAGLQTPPVELGPGFSSPGDPLYANGSYAGPRTSEVVLDQALADLLRVGPGELVWASPRSVANASGLPGWFANASAFRVVGICGPFWLIPSALLGYFHLAELQELEGGAAATGDEASLVLVHLHDPATATTDQSRLRGAFPGLTVLTLSDLLTAIDNEVNLYRTFGALVGLIGLGVAGLFTSSTLLMSVEDRSPEIALLRAIGFRRERIALFVLEEALLLAALGLAIGLPVGFGLSEGLDLALRHLVGALPQGFRFVDFDAAVAAGGLADVLAIGLCASILPIVRAVRGPIASELRAP